MSQKTIRIPGEFVSFPVGGSRERLDGVWAYHKRPKKRLLVFIHGMGGNFFRSAFKKQAMLQGPRNGWDVLSFNNRGALGAVINERFSHCMQDIDAAIAFGRARGYRQFALMGHSTGCQKVTYYQARRQLRAVRAVVLAAPADDVAIFRRDLGKKHVHWMRQARKLVDRGRGDTVLPECNGFAARRFLSAADPTQNEGKIFDYAGRMYHFRKVTCPVLAFFGGREEYAVLPVARMGKLLAERSNASQFDYFTVPGGDHGFHRHEEKTVQRVYRWLRSNVQ
tara:strand:+ start:314 stop:1153 length:840 start_codon:yes stop_codon:yes gene_type:complete